MGGTLFNSRNWYTFTFPLTVGKLLIKPFIEFLRIKRLLPGVVQLDKVAEPVHTQEFIKGEVKKDFYMCSVRIFDADFFNKSYFFQHVFAFVKLM